MPNIKWAVICSIKKILFFYCFGCIYSFVKACAVKVNWNGDVGDELRLNGSNYNIKHIINLLAKKIGYFLYV